MLKFVGPNSGKLSLAAQAMGTDMCPETNIYRALKCIIDNAMFIARAFRYVLRPAQLLRFRAYAYPVDSECLPTQNP